jgi:lipopolysaccharide export system permease protein
VRLLDRYVAASFFRVFVGALLVFAVTTTALDFFGRLDDFFKGKAVQGTFAEGMSQARIIFSFYLAYLPYLLKHVLPFVTLAAGLFTLRALLRNNEVQPIVSAGVSARRLALPIFVCGLVVAAGNFAFQEFAIPSLNRKHVALKRFFSGDGKSVVTELAHLRDGKGTVTQAGSFSFNDRNLRDVIVQRPWTETGFERWTAPVLAPHGRTWTAPEGVIVIPSTIGSLPERLPDGVEVDIGITPFEVEALVAKEGTAEMSLEQVYSLTRRFPLRRNLRVAFHQQMTRPLSGFVLLLVGVPVLLSIGRGRFLGGALVLGLSASYYLLDIFLSSLGDRGDVPPLLAAWLPIAFFLSFGLARLATVPT